tara:strand:+ start:109 stop:1230 length:1122 start_codon:yes stop_codon:yes gene_type:complete
MSFKAILAFEDGSVFHGTGFGKEKYDVGELVFNTSMTGYQEIMTDPSYKKQIVTFTHPHIGNTGINLEDNESKIIHASGMVIKSVCEKPSNWRSKTTLSHFLNKNKVIGISDVDTRKITTILREKGSMNSCIASRSVLTEKEAIAKAKEFEGLKGMDLAKVVSTQTGYDWNEGVWPEYKKFNDQYSVVAYDYGIKENILRLLCEYVGPVKVVNAKTPFNEILNLDPKGIFLSNGPGDPEPCDYAIQNIKKFLEKKIPIFGICLGHQLLALAGGANTYKMKFGHHGANHPVQDMTSKDVFITSQNHGFAVDESTLPTNIKVTHISLFDKSLQGIEFLNTPAFSFQGHPEASPGPQEIQTLFEKFSSMIKDYAKA